MVVERRGKQQLVANALVAERQVGLGTMGRADNRCHRFDDIFGHI